MRSTFLLFLLLLIITACTKTPALHATEGYLEVPGGKIWYRVYGEGDATPLLMLHGGPGYPSYYLQPLAESQPDRPVIIFDQLGCGRSDALTDTTLMTIDAHIDQVQRLLDHLGVKKFYLYGHSWGSMLATDYYLAHPENIEALMLASPCLDAKRWISDSDSLIASLPDSTAKVLQDFTKGLPIDTPAYWQAMKVYMANFYARKPNSVLLDSSARFTSLPVYEYMWGPGEFVSTGTLKNYDRTGELSTIKIPTLYLTGEFDPARPGTVGYYQSLTPGSKLVIIPDAGHSTMHDNLSVNAAAMKDFMKAQDNH